MSDNPRRVAGTANLTVDGVEFPVVGAPGYKVARTERETLPGMSGHHYFAEKPVAGFIKAQVRDVGGLLVAVFQDATDVFVTLALANGKFVNGVGMWQVGSIEVNGADATYDLEFHGEDLREA